MPVTKIAGVCFPNHLVYYCLNVEILVPSGSLNSSNISALVSMLCAV